MSERKHNALLYWPTNHSVLGKLELLIAVSALPLEHAVLVFVTILSILSTIRGLLRYPRLSPAKRFQVYPLLVLDAVLLFVLCALIVYLIVYVW